MAILLRMRGGNFPPSSAGNDGVAKMLLERFDAAAGGTSGVSAAFKGDSVGSCTPLESLGPMRQKDQSKANAGSFAAKGKEVGPAKPPVMDCLTLSPALRKEKLERLPLSPLEPNAQDGAAKLQRTSSPHAVRLDGNSPPKANAESQFGLLGEDPSSRAKAERMLHNIRSVGEWRLVSLLGMGGMSNVYLAQHKRRTQNFSAIKMTKDYIIDTSDKENDPCYTSTMLEWRTYQLFRRPSPDSLRARSRAAKGGGLSKRKQPESSASETRPFKMRKVELEAAEPGHGALPVAYGYGFKDVCQKSREHGWIALQLLGSNLHAVATNNNNPLTWQRFYKLATGMLAAVRELHLCNLVHRDIKPGNFCLGGSNDSDTVYLVDFGFVMSLPLKCEAQQSEKFCGTPDFASSNALQGGRCGAKDDCESLCYSFLQLWNYGIIPWDITRNTPRLAKKGSGDAWASLLPTMEDIGWTPSRLRRMAADRASIWADMAREGEIPLFLLSWQLYLSSLNVWELPNYDLLSKLLHNSCLSWEDHHAAPVTQPVLPQASSSPAAAQKERKPDTLLAPEE